MIGSLGAGAVLVVQTAAVVVVAVRISSRILGPSSGLLDRCFVGLLVGLLEVFGVLQLLGIFDLLTKIAVLLAHLALAALVLWLVPARPGMARQALPKPPLGLLITGGIGVGLALLAVFLGLHGPSLESDTVQYHVVDAGWWLQVHNLWSLPPVDPGYYTNAYPSNGELAGLWLMLPTHTDQLAYVVNVVFGVWVVLSGAVIARELGRPSWVGALAALAVVASPLSFWTQTHSLMTDLAATGGILAGAAFVLYGRRRPGEARWVVMAGLALGIGVGSKDTGFLPALAVIALAIALSARGRRATNLGFMMIGVALPSAFWFVRDWVEVGNPLFPEPVRIFGHQLFAGPTSPLTRYSTSLLQHLLRVDTGPLSTWSHDVGQLVGPVLVLAACGVIVGAVVGIKRRQWELLALSLTAAAAWLAYAVTPYTGGGPDGVTYLITSQLRYALPALFLSAMVAAIALPWIVTTALAAVALLYDAAKIIEGPGYRADLHPTHWMLALAAAGALTSALIARLWSERAAFGRRPWKARNGLGRYAGRAPVRIVAGLSALGAAALVVGACISVLPAPAGSTAVTQALARSGDPQGSVGLVGVADVRALMGTGFQVRVVSIGGGADHNMPIGSTPSLEGQVKAQHVGVIAVGPDLAVFAAGQGSRPSAWIPPGWVLATSEGTTKFYVDP